MDINNIINKRLPTNQEMIFVVEQYIKEKKDKDVEISLNPNKAFHELRLLNKAYIVAAEYFLNKH